MSNVANGTTAVPARSNGFGVAALVLGIVGIFFAQVILGPLAIIFGGIGWNRANHGSRGKGISIAGLVLGVIDLVLFAIVVIAASRNNGSLWRI
jgi:hypothetical protein